MASILQNLIRVLTGMGKTTNDIWKSIKKNPKTKKYNNKRIQAAFETVEKSRQAGQDYGRARASTTLGQMSAGNGGKATGTKTVTYSFHFARQGTGKGGKALSSERVDSVDLPASTTKAQAQAHIRELIQDWLESNYGVESLGGIGSNIRIKSIEDK